MGGALKQESQTMTQAVIGALRAVFGADTAAFEAGLTRVDRESKKSERRLKRFAKSTAQTGKALSVGLSAPLAAIGAMAFKTASDVVELEGAFDVTFKSSAESMRDWAEQTGNTLGRSTQEIQESAVAFASLFNKALDPAQANELTKQFSVLTQDLASFKNLSNDVAQQKLFSGLTGEAEPLRAVGVFINAAAVEAKALALGLEKVNGKYTDQQKIVARAALIQEQLADANGDVIRTSGTTANQIKASKAAYQEMQVVIGTQLLPVLTPLITKIGEIITKFTELSPRMQKTIMVAAGLAAAIGPVMTAIGGIIALGAPLMATIGATITVTGSLTAAMTGLGLSFTAALGPIGLLIAAAGALALGYKALKKPIDEARAAHKEYYDLIEEHKKTRDTVLLDSEQHARAALVEAAAIREKAAALVAERKAALEAAQAQITKGKTNSTLGLGIDQGAIYTAKAANDVLKAANINLAEQESHIKRIQARLDKGFTTPQTKTAPIAKPKADKDKTAAKHKSAAQSIREEITENKRLAEALAISDREYRVVNEQLSLIAAGYKGSTAAARAEAEALVATQDALEGIRTKRQALADQEARAAAEKQAAADKEAQALANKKLAHADTLAGIKSEIDANSILTAALKVSSHEYDVQAAKLQIMATGFQGTAAEARKLAEDLVKSRAALAATQDTGVKDEIEANRILTAALKVSSHEYDVQAAKLQIMATGFQGTAAEARKLAEELVKTRDELAATQVAADKTGDSLESSFKGALDSFTSLVNGIKSGDLGSILEGVAGVISQIFGAKSGSGSGGGLSGLFGVVGSIFGGFKAKGGPVDRNKSYIVGEQGPELFTPGRSGGITANKQINGGAMGLKVIPSPYFDVVVDGRSARVANAVAPVHARGAIANASHKAARRQNKALA